MREVSCVRYTPRAWDLVLCSPYQMVACIWVFLDDASSLLQTRKTIMLSAADPPAESSETLVDARERLASVEQRQQDSQERLELLQTSLFKHSKLLTDLRQRHTSLVQREIEVRERHTSLVQCHRNTVACSVTATLWRAVSLQHCGVQCHCNTAASIVTATLYNTVSRVTVLYS